VRGPGNNPVLPESPTAELAQEVADLRIAVESQPAWRIRKAVQDAKREFWKIDGGPELLGDVLNLIDAEVGDAPPHSLGRCKARCLVACIESLLEYVD
jgi:hypothetical protein